MTGRERAAFRAEANALQPIFQIGKGDINDNLVQSVSEALQKRELIKLSVLDTAGVDAKQAAAVLAEATGAEIIQCIGRRFVLYRQRTEE